MPGEHFGRRGGFQEGQIKKIHNNHSHSQRVIKVNQKIAVKIKLRVQRNQAHRSKLPKSSIIQQQHIFLTQQTQTLINQTHPTTSAANKHPPLNLILLTIIRNLNLPKRRIQRLQAQRSAPRPWHLLLSIGRQVRWRVEIKQDERQGHAVLPK
jgi:hypothetical protein